MTKEETKQRIAVMQAYVDGKQVQVYDISLSKWFDTDAPSWITSRQFRIKPEPSYRPFRNAEECWQEMLKHAPLRHHEQQERKGLHVFHVSQRRRLRLLRLRRRKLRVCIR